MQLLRRAIALEENADGKAINEIEITMYAKLLDMADLLKAFSKEHHEQWMLKIPHTPNNIASGNMRVRKTIPHITSEVAEYTYTTKIDTHDKKSKIEVTVPTTEDNFKQYQMICDKAMIKDRYCFKVPNSELIIEVDMFYLKGADVGTGRYSDICKIDIELPNIDTPLPELPINVTDIIHCDNNTTPEANAIIDDYYENIFLTKNKFIHPDR